MPRKIKPRLTAVEIENLDDSLRVLQTQLGYLREHLAQGSVPAARLESFRRATNSARLEIYNAQQTLAEARTRVRYLEALKAPRQMSPGEFLGHDIDRVLEALPVGGAWLLEAATVKDMAKLQVRVKNRQDRSPKLAALKFKTSTFVAVGSPIGNVRYIVRVERLDELLDRQEREAEGTAGSA